MDGSFSIKIKKIKRLEGLLCFIEDDNEVDQEEMELGYLIINFLNELDEVILYLNLLNFNDKDYDLLKSRYRELKNLSSGVSW